MINRRGTSLTLAALVLGLACLPLSPRAAARDEREAEVIRAMALLAKQKTVTRAIQGQRCDTRDVRPKGFHDGRYAFWLTRDRGTIRSVLSFSIARSGLGFASGPSVYDMERPNHGAASFCGRHLFLAGSTPYNLLFIRLREAPDEEIAEERWWFDPEDCRRELMVLNAVPKAPSDPQLAVERIVPCHDRLASLAPLYTHSRGRPHPDWR